jgi:hypothetical protein
MSNTNEQNKSINWFRDLVERSKRVGRTRVRTLRGKLWYLTYTPKHAEKLPYYDENPLVFVLEVRSTYMLGLNLHYLPPSMRSHLFEALVQHDVVFDEEDEIVSKKLRYANLNEFSQSGLASVCLKRYNTRFIRNWTMIAPPEWQNAVNLPLYTFKKQSSHVVWRDTLRKLGTNG